MAITNILGQTRVGVRSFVFTPEEPGTPMTIDQDSTNFIIASGLSDSLQISAIETLVSDLKTYGLWTKMRAIYPFVGGSATSHKLNLKDPRNLDAAYRLNFYGGWTHTSTGAKPNGTTGYADTFLNSNVLGQNDLSFSVYLGSDNTNEPNASCPIGAYLGRWGSGIYPGTSTGNVIFFLNGGSNTYANDNTTRGMYMASKTTSFSFTHVRGVKADKSFTTSTPVTSSFKISKAGDWPGDYNPQEQRFIHIGDGLTDTEAANFYTAVQKFNTTLGRQIGVPVVADVDAQSFLNAAVITNSTQATAINKLVTDLKSAGIWTKMKALYPFVGGTATSHKWNLKDSRDLDAAYRLIFSGGWTHTSSGVKPNGSNAYAMTYLSPSASLTNNNYHLSYYSREQITTGNSVDIGCSDTTTQMISATHWYQSANVKGCVMGSFSGALTVTSTNSNTLGLLIGTRTTSTLAKQYMNGVQDGASVTALNTYSLLSRYVVIGGNYVSGGVTEFTTRQSAFASIGDGLTDSESSAFYTAVQTFQTTLGRHVGVPIVSDGDAQAFLNAATITSVTQASAVNTLVTDLKAANIWTKMKALYPFVGGTSTSHKFNLKDPRDINEAYRLTFSGGVTHDSNGIKGSTNGYANTYFSPLTLNQNSIHFSWYSNMNSLGVKADIGTLGGGRLLGYSINGAGTNWAVRINNTSNVFSSTQTTDTIGFYQVSRTSSTSIIMQKNNTQDTVSSTSTTSQSNNIILLSGSGSAEFSDRQLQLVTIGDGLTTTEMNTLKTINGNYKTNLGR